ncbi:amidohydrolase family protein [Microbacterium sp. zg.Y1090]|uniref:amidohydrolase family protein n=1 Tax=Microbacterium TaxID=33882 RepID=UPI00214B421F|nr:MULTISPECIES: amidohydrolase family protein [unclassified Microbacterium]MCR2811581.1 amidohydrolase family protein [Microbacterium sp. zg.Y1084]MCR2818997.1 amidohydrolase family protein [Microbacterium sp. zg.Y1090]MDL5487647.1 amidohydrolase family protein [Microbacterium sp. zg-Y1211]WIM27302.1 amidohydrolase family protein [Microbacterium sp. zg-Y1090]
MRILDSHLHLWDPERLDYPWLTGRLLGRFGVAQWQDATAEASSAERAAVFVQAEAVAAQSIDEVDWVSASAAAAGVRGIVARLTMEDAAAARRELALLRARPLVVGVRRLLQGEEAGFATSRDFLASARAVADAGYVFDACVRSGQLRELAALAEAVPSLTIVLDHLGKPDVSGAPAPAWRADLQRLADLPQVSCKLSGLPAESPEGWTSLQFTPFLDAALEAFGPERLLFGGDWPVSWPYASWERFVRDWATSAAPSHTAAILWDNAQRTYRLR